MSSYELSKAAAEDFETIFDFGIDTFGMDQALAYIHGLRQRFIELAEQPEMYPVLEVAHKHYRRSVFGSHSIYYRITPRGILIVRVLGKQDQATALK